MIRIFLAASLLMLLLCTSCFKQRTINSTTTTASQDNQELTDRQWIDQLKQEISRSQALDVEVFIAISICHNDYINQFSQQFDSMTEEQKKAFLLAKKTEFFKTIRYTEAEYSRFMAEHWDDLKKYVDENPHLQQYLISTN